MTIKNENMLQKYTITNVSLATYDYDFKIISQRELFVFLVADNLIDFQELICGQDFFILFGENQENGKIVLYDHVFKFPLLKINNFVHIKRITDGTQYVSLSKDDPMLSSVIEDSVDHLTCLAQQTSLNNNAYIQCEYIDSDAESKLDSNAPNGYLIWAENGIGLTTTDSIRTSQIHQNAFWKDIFDHTNTNKEVADYIDSPQSNGNSIIISAWTFTKEPTSFTMVSSINVVCNNDIITKIAQLNTLGISENMKVKNLNTDILKSGKSVATLVKSKATPLNDKIVGKIDQSDKVSGVSSQFDSAKYNKVDFRIISADFCFATSYTLNYNQHDINDDPANKVAPVFYAKDSGELVGMNFGDKGLTFARDGHVTPFPEFITIYPGKKIQPKITYYYEKAINGSYDLMIDSAKTLIDKGVTYSKQSYVAATIPYEYWGFVSFIPWVWTFAPDTRKARVLNPQFEATEKIEENPIYWSSFFSNQPGEFVDNTTFRPKQSGVYLVDCSVVLSASKLMMLKQNIALSMWQKDPGDSGWKRLVARQWVPCGWGLTPAASVILAGELVVTIVGLFFQIIELANFITELLVAAEVLTATSTVVPLTADIGTVMTRVEEIALEETKPLIQQNPTTQVELQDYGTTNAKALIKPNPEAPAPIAPEDAKPIDPVQNAVVNNQQGYEGYEEISQPRQVKLRRAPVLSYKQDPVQGQRVEAPRLREEELLDMSFNDLSEEDKRYVQRVVRSDAFNIGDPNATRKIALLSKKYPFSKVKQLFDIARRELGQNQLKFGSKLFPDSDVFQGSSTDAVCDIVERSEEGKLLNENADLMKALRDQDEFDKLEKWNNSVKNKPGKSEIELEIEKNQSIVPDTNTTGKRKVMYEQFGDQELEEYLEGKGDIDKIRNIAKKTQDLPMGMQKGGSSIVRPNGIQRVDSTVDMQFLERNPINRPVEPPPLPPAPENLTYWTQEPDLIGPRLPRRFIDDPLGPPVPQPKLGPPIPEYYEGTREAPGMIDRLSESLLNTPETEMDEFSKTLIEMQEQRSDYSTESLVETEKDPDNPDNPEYYLEQEKEKKPPQDQNAPPVPTVVTYTARSVLSMPGKPILQSLADYVYNGIFTPSVDPRIYQNVNPYKQTKRISYNPMDYVRKFLKKEKSPLDPVAMYPRYIKSEITFTAWESFIAWLFLQETVTNFQYGVPSNQTGRMSMHKIMYIPAGSSITFSITSVILPPFAFPWLLLYRGLFETIANNGTKLTITKVA